MEKQYSNKIILCSEWAETPCNVRIQIVYLYIIIRIILVVSKTKNVIIQYSGRRRRHRDVKGGEAEKAEYVNITVIINNNITLNFFYAVRSVDCDACVVKAVSKDEYPYTRRRDIQEDGYDRLEVWFIIISV